MIPLLCKEGQGEVEALVMSSTPPGLPLQRGGNRQSGTQQRFYVVSRPSGFTIMSNAARRVRLLRRATIMAKPVSNPK